MSACFALRMGLGLVNQKNDPQQKAACDVGVLADADDGATACVVAGDADIKALLATV